MHTFKVKVRATPTYLWGDASLRDAFPLDLPITFRVDDFGEAIAFGTQDENGDPHTFGTLQPGGTYSMNLKSTTGIFAKCVDPEVHTFVVCTIGPAVP